MPVLYWDGEELAQSMAIARFVARKVLKIIIIITFTYCHHRHCHHQRRRCHRRHDYQVGLAGNSDLEFCQADMIACHYEDIWTKLPKMKFAKSQEEREELAKDFLNEFIPKFLSPLEAILAKRGNGWFAGNNVTFADLAIMCALDWLQEPLEMSFKDMNNVAERKKILDDFPLVKANYQKTNEVPFVVEWKKKRPAFAGF